MGGVGRRELARVVVGARAAGDLLLGLVEVPHLVLEVDRGDALLLAPHLGDVLAGLVLVVGLVAAEVAGLGLGLLAGLRGLAVALEEGRANCELGGLAGLDLLVGDGLDVLLLLLGGVPRVY